MKRKRSSDEISSNKLKKSRKINDIDKIHYQKIIDDIKYHNSYFGSDSNIDRWDIKLITQDDINPVTNTLELKNDYTYCLITEDIQGMVEISADCVFLGMNYHTLSAPGIGIDEIGLHIHHSSNVFVGTHDENWDNSKGEKMGSR